MKHENVFTALFVHRNHIHWQVFIGCITKPPKKNKIVRWMYAGNQLPAPIQMEWHSLFLCPFESEGELFSIFFYSRCVFYFGGFCWCFFFFNFFSFLFFRFCACCHLFACFIELYCLVHLTVLFPLTQITRVVGVGKLDNFLSAWLLLNAEGWCQVSRVCRSGRPNHWFSCLPFTTVRTTKKCRRKNLLT